MPWRQRQMYELETKYTLQRNTHLCIPRKGIAWPQSQFPHSCVCERFMYSRIGSVNIFSCIRIGKPIVGIYKSLADTWRWNLGLRPRNSFSGNFRYFVFAAQVGSAEVHRLIINYSKKISNDVSLFAFGVYCVIASRPIFQISLQMPKKKRCGVTLTSLSMPRTNENCLYILLEGDPLYWSFKTSLYSLLFCFVLYVSYSLYLVSICLHHFSENTTLLILYITKKYAF